MNKNSYLPPRLLQILGILLLIGSAVFWAITGRESLLLMSAAMSLIGLGAFQGIRVTLTQELPPINENHHLEEKNLL